MTFELTSDTTKTIIASYRTSRTSDVHASRRYRMRSLFFKSAALVIFGLAMSGAPAAENSAATSGTGPTFKYIGPLTFGPADTLFAADAQDVSIYALKLGNALQGSAMGTKNVANIDQQLAALAGTEAANITITDMAVSPKSHN